MRSSNYIAIVDFGSQTTMLIARVIRELGFMAKIVPHHACASLRTHPPEAIVLSGGPESMFLPDAPQLDPIILDVDVPILGICYGMQLIAHHFGGNIAPAHRREFGSRGIMSKGDSAFLDGVPAAINVWMSHSDQVVATSAQIRTLATSESCKHAVIEVIGRPIFGVQFHPEVSHSEFGRQILINFLSNIAQASKNFALPDILHEKIQEIKDMVGTDHVVMGLSGGVDSSVAAALIHRAIGDQLHCVYVHHGLNRIGELEEITTIFSEGVAMEVNVVDAREQFFASLVGVTDPEIKRKKIGHVFVEVFEHEATRWPNAKWLGQGTLYPDVIESSSHTHATSHVIKTHHNVGGLPNDMKLRVLEPLKDLFKDEVRVIGKMLGLPDSVVMRQPFPGPGLAIRIPGEVTMERVTLLQKADAIVREEIASAYRSGEIVDPMWQWFAILLPIKSVGVMGDARVYGETVVIRCVESSNAMTADWVYLPRELLRRCSNRITNEVTGIARVLYDITQKPPGTIEWE